MAPPEVPCAQGRRSHPSPPPQLRTPHPCQVVADCRNFEVTCVDRPLGVKRYAPVSANAIAVASDEEAVERGVAALKREPKGVVCRPPNPRPRVRGGGVGVGVRGPSEGGRGALQG